MRRDVFLLAVNAAQSYLYVLLLSDAVTMSQFMYLWYNFDITKFDLYLTFIIVANSSYSLVS